MNSENNTENKKEGLKYITQVVYRLIRENNGCTYAFICENIQKSNKQTLNRRIYDVLNVMRSVKIIDKKDKRYYILNRQENLNKKKEEITKLQDMKTVFEYIVKKNRNRAVNDDRVDKLYLPFMIIKTSPEATIHCDTNEERTFFTFKSSKEIELVEDLEVLKELYNNENIITVVENKENRDDSQFNPFFF